MYEIAKTFEFSAAHRLLDVGDHHPCATLHGHNYKVELIARTESLDSRGFCLFDYREFGAVKDWINANFDHKTILRYDDHMAAAFIGTRTAIYDGLIHDKYYCMRANPTAEHLAKLICNVANGLLGGVRRVSRVRVSETPNTWAEYSE